MRDITAIKSKQGTKTIRIYCGPFSIARQILYIYYMEIREPAVAYGKQKFSVAEYLKEDAASEKHEYYRGEIFAMCGSKIPHNEISGNLYAALQPG